MATKKPVRKIPVMPDEEAKKSDWASLIDSVKENPVIYGAAAGFIVLCLLAGLVIRVNSSAARREGMTQYAKAMGNEDPALRVAAFDALAQGSRLTYLEEPAMLLNVVDVTEQRLAAEQRASLSRKILVAQEEERARIARDLHDGLGQVIAALHLEVDWTRNRLADTSGVPHGEFAQAASLIEEAGAKLRGICRGLRPPLLDDFGLMPAIRQLVDEVREHTSLEIDLEEKLDEDRLSVPPEGALCVFRVLQEALTNVARHAEAPKVWVTLVREYQWLILSVYDSGRGFDANDPESGGGYGIEGMHERAGLVGGSVKVHSVPDQGTRVVLRVPVPRQPEEEGT